LRDARREFDAGKFAAASGKLEELLKRILAPGERAEAYVLLCESRLRQGQFAVAESLAVEAKTAGRVTDEAALEHLGFLKAEILYFSGDMKGATDEYISFLEDDLEGSFVNDAVERLLLIDENTGSSPQPLAAYARAELADLAGAPDSALAILDGILRDPSSPLIADDALAKKADILCGLRRFPDAVTQYRLVEVRFPQSRLVPACKLKIAGIYALEMGEKEKAIAECEEVAKGFPGTSYAVEARAMLAALTGGAQKDGK
jgi:tetratricopeptide (TPR) repeat protein